LSFYEEVGVGVLKIEESELEVLKIEESESLCTNSTALVTRKAMKSGVYTSSKNLGGTSKY
jgi:hypothetical protein